MRAFYVRGCARCPFFWPPHCSVLHLESEVGKPAHSRVMADEKCEVPHEAPPQCPLRQDAIAVVLSETPGA